MKLIETKNRDYNNMLTFKTYLFDEKESDKAKKDVELYCDLPFYLDESIDFHCESNSITLPQQMRLLFMGVSEEQLEEIKESNYVIVTCVHE